MKLQTDMVQEQARERCRPRQGIWTLGEDNGAKGGFFLYFSFLFGLTGV
jgi:hypothetical protein